MPFIIAYGSLINKNQLSKQSHLLSTVGPVWVKGYKRIFNQEPSWRQGLGKQRAVLNIEPSEQDYFNGILVEVKAEKDIRELDKRERGYVRTLIPESQLYSSMAHSTESTHPSHVDLLYVYVGKPDKQNNNILPNKDYLEICLKGTKQWSDECYEQFLQTTYVGTHTLKTFLQTE